MGDNTDLLTTKKGKLSAARINYTANLLKHIRPQGFLKRKAEKILPTKKKGPMSKNQWKQVMDARGSTGKKYFEDLIQLKIMNPEGTVNTGNRYYEQYSLDKKKLGKAFTESSQTQDLVEAFEYAINNFIEGKMVRKDY